MNRIKKIEDMLLKTPQDCFLLHALGLEYQKIGDLQQAITAFRKVLHTDANYVGTYYHLAKTLEMISNSSEAIQVYEKGIEIATLKKDLHARNELQMALDDLID